MERSHELRLRFRKCLQRDVGSTQFTFTEGHIRLLIWMCDQQAEALENCFDEALKNNEDPSDVVLNCREGVFELKCWH